ncbi:CHASE4 domain-containing protein [Corallincola spongiicola]|uniref:PAS domain-containing protein n=1 Tax=Corallincola spongiicola TaxID=2520508 RepID=A0ABY1WU95_9GAMM|nr:CHASE4 domain-containing protein [Corallincola spongiicola]TAA48326.1 PAS domain-containing protein [Corallincola spongiicola]
MSWKKSVERRLLITIGACCSVLLLVMLLSTAVFVHLEQQSWENNRVTSLGEMASELIENRYQQLADLSLKYAKNDATYQYIEDASYDFVVSNLQLESLRNSRVVGILIQDHEGYFINSKSTLNVKFSNLMTDGLLDLPLQENDALYQQGVMTFHNQIYLFVRVPVTDSTGTALTNGAITLIREFDNEMMKDIGSDMGAFFNLEVVAPSLALKVFAHGFNNEATLMNVARERGKVRAHFSLYPTDNAYVLQGQIVFDQYQGGWTNLLWLIVIILVALSVAVYLMHYWLKQQITLPVQELVKHLGEKQSVADPYRPIISHREDEFGALSAQINRVFSQLYQQHTFNRVLFDAIGEAIVTVDFQGRLTFANPAAVSFFGLDESLLLQQRLDFLISNQTVDSPCATSMVRKITQHGEHIDLACQLRVLSNNEKVISTVICGHPMQLDDDTAMGAVFIIRIVKSHAVETKTASYSAA